jgi:DNA-binding CsgD family transcriptional regulator/HPt (histidine-containing phosphotransfer) domain-containing protein
VPDDATATPPETRFALGGLAYADNDFDGARTEWEQAYRDFQARGDRRAAVRVAAALADLHGSVLGNRAAGSGWVQRGLRLLEPEGRCVELGYLELAYVACEVLDVGALERSARRALDIALEFGDTNLEVRALADWGYALVSQGRVKEGFARLDEAMAALTAGDVDDPKVAGTSYCALLSACDRAGALQRAEEWTRLVDEALARLDGRPRILYTHCRLAYGSVLADAGRWSEAEVALLDAIATSAAGSRAHRPGSLAALAELRLHQGRIGEAEELLREFEDDIVTCAALSRMHLIHGEHALAAAVARRGLGQLVADSIRQGGLLANLVEIELARDDIAQAERDAHRLTEIAAASDLSALHAQAALAQGRVAAARGEPDRALEHFAEAERTLGEEPRALLTGTICLERAQALAAAGDTAGAIAAARAALAAFERLGAKLYADRTAALLRRLGSSGRPRAREMKEAATLLTAREHEVLALLGEGLTNAEIGARLYISPKTAEHHVGRVLAKLGVRTRAEAAAVAAR